MDDNHDIPTSIATLEAQIKQLTDWINDAQPMLNSAYNLRKELTAKLDHERKLLRDTKKQDAINSRNAQKAADKAAQEAEKKKKPPQRPRNGQIWTRPNGEKWEWDSSYQMWRPMPPRRHN